MQTNIRTPKQALNPAFLKQKPEREEIELFKKEFISLLDKINDSETEEFHKNLITDFLNSVYYRNNHYINTKGYTDLVIHNGKDAKSPVGVLIEVKKPTNKSEMVSKENLNAKSFQELVLYYFRERSKAKNFELRYLIITNINEWFVFDAQDFERLFYQNKTLLKHFKQFENKTLSGTSTDFFYKDIASPEIEKIKLDIPYSYFDIRDYNKILRNKDKEDDKKLIALYKFLSPINLLKLPFANDYNQLNKEFYAELLHILGLEEIKQKSQKFIVRKPAGKRDNGSIIENAINELDSKDKIYRLSNASQYGNTYEEKLFNVALDLSITWINRILFLKLLEAQVIKYNNDNKHFSFLSANKINDYDVLDGLFFKILARKEEDRKDSYLKERFQHVPYLNSSLFEQTDLEQSTITINSLDNNARISLYSKSVLKIKNVETKQLSPLEYLLKFLDAYDFSSEGSEDIQEENKALISASVLGLIFEKINGYKDGSFFTPSFITMFMCRDTITRTIIQKFNEVKGWECKTIIDLHNKISDIEEANKIINSIRVCDPAVGSGHFLVSSLNEMIHLKSELGILADKEGKLLKGYKISIENDELIVSDKEFGIFKYNPLNYESQRVQETLFHEKQTIIENCLFGVDINPNSVKICQLRLWIELLKHTYYIPDTNQLETLPNIDINIKCGNSLVNRFSLDENLRPVLQKLKIKISDYREAVSKYRNAQNKQDKRDLEKYISDIKSNLKTEIYQNHPLKIRLSKKRGELDALGQGELFGTIKKEKNKQKEVLQKDIKKLESQISEIETNRIYQNAFEWRIEFPEVLNDDGVFIGFDAIIGNPPYIQLQSMGEITDVYKQMDYQTFERTGDIYCLFYELGKDLLRQNYFLSFITSNKWMRAGYGQSMRKYFVEQTNPTLLIDFAGIKVFDEATVDVNIMTFQKSENQHNTKTCQIKGFNSEIMKLSDYVNQFSILSDFNEKAISSFVILSSIEKRIKEKIENIGIPLKDWDIQINYGIKTGFNEAFIIDGKTKDELIVKSSKNAEIIRPILRGRDIKRYGYEFADIWLICTHNGTPTTPPINIEEYPDIKAHLDKYFPQLSDRQDKGYTPYNLRSCIYMDDFFKQKIIYPNMTKFMPFLYDEKGFMTNQKCFIITGENIAFLTAFFNSSLFKYCFRDNFPELQGGTRELSKIFFETIPVIKINSKINDQFFNKISETQHIKSKNKETKDLETEIDNMIFDLYDLSPDERKIIGFVEIQ